MNRRDQAAGLFWLLISIFIVYKAFELGVGSFSTPGPGFVLCGAGLLLGILSIVLVIMSMAGKSKKSIIIERSHGSLGKVLITITGLVLYALFLRSAGFLLVTFGFMLLLYLMGKFKPWVAFLAALLSVALSYTLFHVVLQVPFPRGPFTW